MAGEDIKKVAQELGAIRMFLLNSIETVFTEMQDQTSVLLSIKDAVNDANKNASKAQQATTEKADTNDKAAGGAGTFNLKDFMKDLATMAVSLPKVNKAMKDMKASHVNNFNRFLRNMTKAITQDGKYGEPAQIQELYKVIGKVFSDLGDSIGKFSKGLILFGIVAKLKLDDIFIKFVGKMFDKQLMDKLDPEPAEKAGHALLALAKGIGLFALVMAVSGPLFILGLPSLIIGIPVIMGVFFLLGKMGGMAEQAEAGKNMLIGMSVAILALAVAMIMMRFVQPEDILKTVALIGVFALFLAITSKLVGGGDGGGPGVQAMLGFSVGLLGLTAAMILMKYVEWESIFKAGAVMLVMGLMFMMINTDGGNAKDAAILLGTMALSMIALVFVVRMYKDIEWETIGKSMAVLGGLALTVWALGKNTKYSIAGILTIFAMVLALWALSEIIPLYGKLSWEEIGKAGAVVGGLGIALWRLGQRATDVLKGAAAMLIATVAIGALVYAIKKFTEANPTWEQLGMMGAAVGGLGLAMAGFGFLSELILAGSYALLVAGGAMYVISKAIALFAENYDGIEKLFADSGHVTDSTFGFGGGRMMSKLEYAFLSIASSFLLSPLTIASMYASAPAFMMAGRALTDIGKGLLAFAGLNVPLDQLADPKDPTKGTIYSVLTAVSAPFATIGKMQDVSGGWFGMGQNPVAKGIASVSGIGRVLIDVAEGVQEFANMTFTNPKTGKTTTITASTLKVVTKNITDVITSISSVFLLLGQTNGKTYFWDDGLIANGVKSIKGVGSELFNIAKAVQGFANLTYTDADGKKQQLTDTMIGPTGTIALNIKNMIIAISSALGEIGSGAAAKGGWWFGDSAIDKGKKAIAGVGDQLYKISEVVKTMAEQAGKMDAVKLEAQMKAMIGAAGNILVDTGNKYGKLNTSAALKYFTSVSDKTVAMANVGDKLATTATAMDKISNSLVKVLGVLDKLAVDKLARLADVFGKLVEVGKLDATKINGIFDKAGVFAGTDTKEKTAAIYTPPAPAAAKGKVSVEEFNKLKEDNEDMKMIMSQLLKSMQAVESALTRGTIRVSTGNSKIGDILNK